MGFLRLSLQSFEWKVLFLVGRGRKRMVSTDAWLLWPNSERRLRATQTMDLRNTGRLASEPPLRRPQICLTSIVPSFA